MSLHLFPFPVPPSLFLIFSLLFDMLSADTVFPSYHDIVPLGSEKLPRPAIDFQPPAWAVQLNTAPTRSEGPRKRPPNNDINNGERPLSYQPKGTSCPMPLFQSLCRARPCQRLQPPSTRMLHWIPFSRMSPVIPSLYPKVLFPMSKEMHSIQSSFRRRQWARRHLAMNFDLQRLHHPPNPPALPQISRMPKSIRFRFRLYRFHRSTNPRCGDSSMPHSFDLEFPVWPISA